MAQAFIVADLEGIIRSRFTLYTTNHMIWHFVFVFFFRVATAVLITLLFMLLLAELSVDVSFHAARFCRGNIPQGHLLLCSSPVVAQQCLAPSAYPQVLFLPPIQISTSTVQQCSGETSLSSGVRGATQKQRLLFEYLREHCFGSAWISLPKMSRCPLHKCIPTSTHDSTWYVEKSCAKKGDNRWLLRSACTAPFHVHAYRRLFPFGTRIRSTSPT